MSGQSAVASRVDMTAADEPHSRRCGRGGNLPVTDLSTVMLGTPEVVTRKWFAMSSPAALGLARSSVQGWCAGLPLSAADKMADRGMQNSRLLLILDWARSWNLSR